MDGSGDMGYAPYESVCPVAILGARKNGAAFRQKILGVVLGDVVVASVVSAF